MVWKIITSISIVFVIGFGSLFFVNGISSSSTGPSEEEVFFNQEFDRNKKLILLIGSSHIAHLNMDTIVSRLSSEYPNYEIYNLPKNHDTPEFRYDMVDDIISLEPEIIFYGVSYREFESKKSLNESPSLQFDLKRITDEQFFNVDFINPQLITKQAVRIILDQTGIQKTLTYDITHKNSPFTTLSVEQTKIRSETELQRQLSSMSPIPSTIFIDPEKNENAIYFKQILSEFEKNDIKFIIFTTPLHELYLNSLPNVTKTNFEKLIDNFSDEFDFPKYDFTHKYSTLPIWNNPDHIAFHDDAQQYSNDIATMIIQEIDQ